MAFFLLLVVFIVTIALSSDWQSVDESIAPGDIVRLKSGGPEMLVEDPTKMDPGDSGIYCCWFTKSGDVKRTYFDAALLEVKK